MFYLVKRAPFGHMSRLEAPVAKGGAPREEISAEQRLIIAVLLKKKKTEHQIFFNANPF